MFSQPRPHSNTRNSLKCPLSQHETRSLIMHCVWSRGFFYWPPRYQLLTSQWQVFSHHEAMLVWGGVTCPGSPWSSFQVDSLLDPGLMSMPQGSSRRPWVDPCSLWLGSSPRALFLPSNLWVCYKPPNGELLFDHYGIYNASASRWLKLPGGCIFKG